MPIGNFTKQLINNDKIQLSDCQEFILGLLKDVVNDSTNTYLVNAVVNYDNDLNLGDLNNSDKQTNLLATFKHNQADPRNSNLNAKHNDSGRTIKVVYEIGLIGQKGSVKSIDFLRAFEQIIDSVSNNRNGTGGQPTAYQSTLSSGKILSTSLVNNDRDDFQGVFIYEEDPQQPNYLTASINVVFVIVNNT
jgi:hypothetical protein